MTTNKSVPIDSGENTPILYDVDDESWNIGTFVATTGAVAITSGKNLSDLRHNGTMIFSDSTAVYFAGADSTIVIGAGSFVVGQKTGIRLNGDESRNFSGSSFLP